MKLLCVMKSCTNTYHLPSISNKLNKAAITVNKLQHESLHLNWDFCLLIFTLFYDGHAHRGVCSPFICD